MTDRPEILNHPEAWAVVPVEPTPELAGAWYRHKNGFHWYNEPAPEDTSDYGAYRAMLLASPSPAALADIAAYIAEEERKGAEAFRLAIHHQGRAEAAEARVKELEAERVKADHKLVDRYRNPKTGMFNFPGDVAAIVRRLDVAEARNRELEARLAEAAEVIEPFASVGVEVGKSLRPDDHEAWGFSDATITYGDFRAARAWRDKA